MSSAKLKFYQKEAIKTQIAAADPYQIIQMLMEGALQSMKIAIINIEQKDYENKSKFISKASSIIDSLRLSLDSSVGGEMTENLESLYYYMTSRLTDATVGNDVSILKEVIDLLSVIKSAWDEIPEAARTEAYQTMDNRASVSNG